MSRTMRRLTYIFAATVAAIPLGAFAEEEKATAPEAPASEATEGEGPTNDDCMACHTDPSTQRADGKPVLVDPAKWKSSIHGELGVACVDCHADLAKAELPHPDELKPAQCVSCHEKAVPAFAKGVHSRTRVDGKGPNATCTSCHGDGHDILAAGDRRAPTHHLNLLSTCAKCHDDAKLIETVKLPGGIVQKFQDSIHGRALTKAGLLVAPTCNSCHGEHDVRAVDDPQSPVFRLNQAATCGKCHEGIQEKYDVSIHAAKVAQGDEKAPVCSSCHSAHSIQRGDLLSWQLDVIGECGTCHKESLHSYRDTFHGRVTELGFARVAKCADCHGFHDIVGKNDPKSRVAGANRLATCRTCHPNATASFVKYDPHANPNDKRRSASLYYTALLMKGLLFGVFGFFGFHTLLWLGRLSIDRWWPRRRPSKKRGK